MSTQRKRASRTLGTKLNEIDGKATQALSSPNIPASGSVTPGSFAENSVGEKAIAPNAVGPGAIQTAAVNTEQLGTVNQVNSDSTLVLNASVGVALSGDAYADRLAPSTTANRASTPTTSVTMDPTGTLVAGDPQISDSIKIGMIDPAWTDGLVGIYFDNYNPPYFLNNPVGGVYSGYTAASAGSTGRQPDGYYPWATTYTPVPGDIVMLGHDTSSPNLAGFDKEATRAGYRGDGWIILGKFTGTNHYNIIQYNSVAAYSSNFGQLTGGYQLPWYTKTRANIVSINGLYSVTSAVAAGSTIGWVRPDFAPDFVMYFPAMSSGTAITLGVDTTGRIFTQNALAANGWVTLSNIRYPGKGTPWKNVAAGNGTFGASFKDWNQNGVGPVGYWIDPYGFCWWKGCVQLTAAVSTDPTAIVTGPNETFSYGPQTYHLVACNLSNNGFALLGQSSTVLQWKNGSPGNVNDVISLAYHSYPTSLAGQTNVANQGTKYYGTTFNPAAYDGNAEYITLGSSDSSNTTAFQNSWVQYSTGAPGTVSYGAYWERPDGLVYTQGLIKSGTMNAAAWTPKQYNAPSGRLIFEAVAANASARFDILQTATIPQSGSNLWYSQDGHVFIRQA